MGTPPLISHHRMNRPVGPWLSAGLLALAWSAPVAAGSDLTVRVTSPAGRPVPGIAVYLPGIREPGPVAPVIVDQRDETFVPAVSVAPVGAEVEFTNSDRTSHHVYSFSKPNAFELPLYKGDARLSRRFANPGVVVLGCNIHDSMLGYVVVVDSTRSGLTDADGRLTLKDVPAGRHPVHAWAPGLDRANPPRIGVVEVLAGTPASAAFTVDAEGVAAVPKQHGSLSGSDY